MLMPTACALGSLVLHSGCHCEQVEVGEIAEWAVGVLGGNLHIVKKLSVIFRPWFLDYEHQGRTSSSRHF